MTNIQNWVATDLQVQLYTIRQQDLGANFHIQGINREKKVHCDNQIPSANKSEQLQ